MDESGLAEVWVESGLLGQDTVELVRAGKAYNKGMRAHRLMLQALWRIMAPTLLLFVAEVDKECHDQLSKLAANEDRERIPELMTLLTQEHFHKLMKDFIDTKSKDMNFTFWWRYMDMVSTLLQLI